MLSLDKQPQTCYVKNELTNLLSSAGIEGLEQLKNIYIYTPEELAQAFREVAEKAWIEAKSLSNLYLYEYLDQHYPLPIK